MIAVITMFIDHLTCCFLEVARASNGASLMYSFEGGVLLDQIGRGAGRIAFPIFCFFLVEGYVWTRNRAQYLGRLLLFGLISHFPFRWVFYPGVKGMHTDTLFTLAFGFVAIWGIDLIAGKLLPARFRPVSNGEFRKNREQDQKKVMQENNESVTAETVFKMLFGVALMAAWTGLMCFSAYKLGTDYRYGGVLAIVILYILYRKQELKLAGSYLWLSYYNEAELLSLPSFLLLEWYSGERGKQNKYFFYIFYPVHLLLLFLIRKMIFGR